MARVSNLWRCNAPKWARHANWAGNQASPAMSTRAALTQENLCPSVRWDVWRIRRTAVENRFKKNTPFTTLNAVGAVYRNSFFPPQTCEKNVCVSKKCSFPNWRNATVDVKDEGESIMDGWKNN